MSIYIYIYIWRERERESERERDRYTRPQQLHEGPHRAGAHDRRLPVVGEYGRMHISGGW